jgi:hypothetical protein
MSPAKYRRLLAALAFGSMAAAAPLAMAQTDATQVRAIEIAPSLQTKLDKDYGQREARILKEELQRSVDRTLQKVGKSRVAFVDLTIEDAKPNKPTFQQLARNSSLSYSGSYSLGGARVQAKLYDSSGALLGTVSHEYYSSSLADITSEYGWADADRAFNGAARKIRKEAERAS